MIGTNHAMATPNNGGTGNMPSFSAGERPRDPITVLDWGLWALAIPLGLLAGLIYHSKVTYPLNYGLGALVIGMAALMVFSGFMGKRAPTLWVAMAIAIPSVLIIAASGGLAGPAIGLALVPFFCLLAFGVPMPPAFLVTLATALAGILVGNCFGTHWAALAWPGKIWGLPPLAVLSNGILAIFAIAAINALLAKNAATAAKVAMADGQTDVQHQLVEKAQQEAKGRARMIAELGHEIRGPLGSMITSSELIRDQIMGPVSENYRGYADIIHQSGTHLLGLVNDVLDLSKIEAGRYEIERKPVNLGQILQESATIMAPSAQGANVRLKWVAGPDVMVMGDKQTLKQIALNLLSNAIKFTPEHGQVVLEAHKDGAFGAIIITDNGKGMDKEQLARAMDPYQSEANQPRGAKGTGLGLALVREFAHLHDGGFSLASTLGQGTIAKVFIPLAEPENSAD